VWLHARMLCGCVAGCEVVTEHGAGSGDHEDKQSRRRRVPNSIGACHWHSIFVKHVLLNISDSWPTRVRCLHSWAVWNGTPPWRVPMEVEN